MRTLRLIFILASFSLVAFGSETYNFKYNFKGEILTIKQEAKDPNQALSLAAKSCFHHFKKNQKLSENTGLDLIDVCANPKSI